MQHSNASVKTLVREIRKRWKRRALVQGAALTLLVLVFFGTLLLVLYTRLSVPPPYLLPGIVAAALILLGTIAWFVVYPGFRRISDRQIALFVEERMPELEDRLNSAVEIDGSGELRTARGSLLDRLLDDAAYRMRMIPVTTVVDRRKERILAYTAGAFSLLFVFFVFASLDDLKRSVSEVGLVFLPAAEPLMTVSPGNAEIEKGASQEILVELREDTERDVVLHYRFSDDVWQKEVMKKGFGKPLYLQEFFDIQEPITYFVEYDQQRSDPFNISLYEFPDVSRINVTYSYPSYTGLSPRTEEDTGDVRGLKGSRVTLSVETTGAVEKAEIVLNDEKRLPLKAAGEGRFQTTLSLDQPGVYSIRLTDRQDKQNKFPDEYQIVPLDDEPPYITVTDPQRDVRVNAIEEVLVAASVQDDYGVKEVRLKYSVNGGDEQTMPLTEKQEGYQTEVSGEHLFFLEDFSLQPGDVISYYVEAEDYSQADAPQATDMYFIEVIPFDQRFSQVNNMGAPMPAGQPSQTVLSQQQIIAATWKLHRERPGMDQAAFDEAAKALTQAQENLRQNIEQRINTTAFSLELLSSEENRQIVAYLREAISEMEDAVRELQQAKLQEALTPERRALNQLLRADALNKEKQVAMNRQPGASSGSSTEERMTELMDLELDISKDKYEMQQQTSRPQQEQQVDEALQRIRELARKQENLVNRNLNPETKGEDKKRAIDQLKRDQEELREQAESMANSLKQMSRGNEQISQRMQEQMERIAQNMREAQQALRKGDDRQAMTRQQQALKELEQLQQQLQINSTGNTREAIQDLTRRFEQFKEQERALAQDLHKAQENAEARSGKLDEAELERLQEKRRAMRENLKRLEDQVAAIQESARNSDAELSTAARNMLQKMRRDELEQMMQESEQALEGGWLDFAGRVEKDIQSSLDGLEDQMRAMGKQMPATDEEQLARSLEEVRDLMQQMESLREQMQGQPSGANEQASASGNEPSGNNEQGSASSDPQSGAQGRADRARMQRMAEQARQTLQQLQDRMASNQAMQSALEGLNNDFSDSDFTGQRLEGEAAKAFFDRRIYEPLSQLEQEIARQLDALAVQKKLYGSRKGDVPSSYRTLVEKYYEALAKSRQMNQ